MGAANLSAWNATCNSQDISIKRKVWQFSWYFNLEILCYLASQLLQIEWKILGKFEV
jgi:hypothetical protein